MFKEILNVHPRIVPLEVSHFRIVIHSSFLLDRHLRTGCKVPQTITVLCRVEWRRPRLLTMNVNFDFNSWIIILYGMICSSIHFTTCEVSVWVFFATRKVSHQMEICKHFIAPFAFEKVASDDHIWKYMEINNLLTHAQHAYLRSQWTESALIHEG